MTPIGTAAELDFMLQETGHAVIFGQQSTFGTFRRKGSTVEEHGMLVLLDESRVGVRAGSLTGLQMDLQITIDTSSVAGVVTREDFRIVDVARPSPDGLQWLTLQPRGA